MNNKNINVAIIGASGYTGSELVRILSFHPNVSITSLIAESNAGKHMKDLYPEFEKLELPIIVKIDAIDWNDIDVVFCCLPHATSQDMIAEIPKSVKVIDLSADFRINDANIYEEWYGTPHTQLELQKTAVYGLSEINRDMIKKSRLVACPGCYPTSILLPLIPLLKDEVIEPSNIIINSLSGVSGAGARAEKLRKEIDESIKPYALEGHRHIAEIVQELGTSISFTPTVLPIFRGMISSINVTMSNKSNVQDVKNALKSFYRDEKFVEIVDTAPAASEVNNSNKIRIAVFADQLDGRCKIVSAIDNLAKGASGQAVQNMNIMFSLDEELGLENIIMLKGK